MRRVIIESPYQGENRYQRERNIQYARQCMLDSISRGEAPFLSHLLYTQVLNEDNEKERTFGIDLGLEWGELAEATVVYTDNGISSGMNYGITKAMSCGRSVEYRQLESMLKLRQNMTLMEMLDHVSKYFKVSVEDIKGPSRRLEIVNARHIYMKASIDYIPDSTFKVVGELVNRDHSSVYHAVTDVDFSIEKSDAYRTFRSTLCPTGQAN